MASLILILISTFAGALTAEKLSFSVDYIHRDSPHSPFHNSSQTSYQRFRASVDRDRFRLSKLSNDITSVVAPMTPDSSEYLMSISVGTPPFKIYVIADTGSDLFWTQCVPCQSCYKQSEPKFDPSASSTYKQISCDACPSADNFFCGSDDKCSYSYRYVDGSFANGIGSTETITFDSSSGEKVAVENINMGCTHESKGLFLPTQAGVVGLGRGPMSLISQLGDRIDKQFSYCLVPKTAVGSSSTLHFGPGALPRLVPAPHAVPLPISQTNSTFYSVFLQSIIVGDITVEMVLPVAGSNEGNIIVDSGTTFTYLPDTVVDGLIAAVSKVVTLPTAQNSIFKLCYNIDKASTTDLPDIKMDFGNKAVITFPPLNMFVKMPNSIACLAVLPAPKGNASNSFIGNFAQQNFLVEYDVGIKRVSFTPKDCTKPI